VSSGKNDDARTTEVDLAAAAKLVDALEQDLHKLGGDSPDIQRLRDEVQTLKSVLTAPIRRHHWVRDGLHGIREAFDSAFDAALAEGLKGSQYVAEIGRILGM
jgi:hypothetical protein